MAGVIAESVDQRHTPDSPRLPDVRYVRFGYRTASAIAPLRLSPRLGYRTVVGGGGGGIIPGCAGMAIPVPLGARGCTVPL